MWAVRPTHELVVQGRATSARLSPRLGLLGHLELTHHPVLGVLQDVAVEHPGPRILFELNAEARGRFRANVDGVLPGW